MRFLCVECDRPMRFSERELPGDGTFAALFTCPACNRSVAMLANPAEAQLVSALGVKIGGRALPEQPFELTRSTVASGRDGAFADAAPPAPTAAAPVGAPRVSWDEAARARLERVPSFVRGMVLRIYADYARQRGIATITTEVMDEARRELGLEEM